MKYFGSILKFLTFPGMFLHALWEHLICILYGSNVEDSRAIRLDELSGHVEHDFMDTPGKQFLLCFLPFLFNLILGLLLSGVAVAKIFVLGEKSTILYVILWVGASLLSNLFPLVEDAMFMFSEIYSEKTKLAAKIFAAPIAAILYVGAYLNMYGLTVFTTAGFLALCLI
ncbi:MAG: hypothetical protein K5917_08135 [Clostridiales bacterium]|nr:hypothetical protein [Clostridiales bacterium]